MAGISIFLDMDEPKKKRAQDSTDTRGGLSPAPTSTVKVPKSETQSGFAKRYGMLQDMKRDEIKSDAAQKEAVKKAPKQKRYQNLE